MSTIDEQAISRAEEWLLDGFDIETQQEVKHLLATNPKEAVDAFYRDLEFGTGGLRGVMGVGTNRMNKYTVGFATQGLANYLLKQFSHLPEIRVAIAYDSRNNSPEFANIASNVLTANGIKVYLFDKLRPTPQLSFAVRAFHCQSGIVITASHNPKEYNGYKVYWDDGAQIVPPHDANIISEVKAITSVSQVNFAANKNLMISIGHEIDEMYLNAIASLSLSPEIVRKHNNLKIVYTPIHGTGVEMVPKALQKFGFKHIVTIPQQDVVDGNFPTVVSPNPEEPEALKLAMSKAKEIDADIVMATDPDSDRVGIGVKDLNGNHVLLNGNQAASLLIYYVLTRFHEEKRIEGSEYIVKTIVTSDLLADIAKSYNIDSFEVLTGFKYIAEIIREFEGKRKFLAGGEESYGYLVGTYSRDKDAVLSCAMFAEMAAWAKEQGSSLYQMLIEIYVKYGFYKESLISITRKGKDGAQEIQEMMDGYRTNPPKTLAGSPVVKVHDFQAQQTTVISTGTKQPITLPKSNVIQLVTEDGTRVSVRPSGTEPKIKFYFGVKEILTQASQFEQVNQLLDNKLKTIEKEVVR